jgi:hypothetical protein
MTVLSILLIGFLLGLKHAMESDHLAAVASLATGQHSLAATLRQGVAWGVGHTLTLAIVGGAMLLLGTRMPANLERVLELCVGLMLAVLGADVVRRVLRQRIHFHVHRHGDGEVHFHAHRHDQRHRPVPAAMRWPVVGRREVSTLPTLQVDHRREAHEHQHGRGLPIRALAVGMMHGLAGSAALVVLSLHTVRSVPMGLGYIAVFGIGSIVGMALLSATLAVPLRLSGPYLTSMYRSVASGVGLLTLGLGLWIIYSIAFIEGLLLG